MTEPTQRKTRKTQPKPEAKQPEAPLVAQPDVNRRVLPNGLVVVTR